jgi:hypothetical protein
MYIYVIFGVLWGLVFSTDPGPFRLFHFLAITARNLKINSRTSCLFFESLQKQVRRECYTTYVLRLLAFEGHVIVEWSDAILSSVMTTIMRVVRCVPNTCCRVGVICYGMAVEYTHYKYCNAALSICTCHRRAGKDELKLVLRYPGPPHLDANAFRPQQQRRIKI